MDSKYCSGCKLNQPLSSFVAEDQHDRAWVACIGCRTRLSAQLSARRGRREAGKVVQKELKAVERELRRQKKREEKDQQLVEKRELLRQNRLEEKNQLLAGRKEKQTQIREEKERQQRQQ
jgi:hypothetical protein